jgi:hypothetical protein
MVAPSGCTPWRAAGRELCAVARWTQTIAHDPPHAGMRPLPMISMVAVTAMTAARPSSGTTRCQPKRWQSRRARRQALPECS